MQKIVQQEMSEAFRNCWYAAAQHLNRQVEGGIRSWLRAHPFAPYAEHLSFRLGNQLFFIRIEDVDGLCSGPGDPDDFLTVAESANGHACVLQMKQSLVGGPWEAALPGWSLLDATTHLPIDPVALVSDEKIEMTQWEIHDMAVQIVRADISAKGYKLMSWQGNPWVDPSIWFVGETQGPEWVVVRSVTFPYADATPPDTWEEIADRCAGMSTTGHFASLSLASGDQPFAADGEPALPLWRGHQLKISFGGLQTVE